MRNLAALLFMRSPLRANLALNHVINHLPCEGVEMKHVILGISSFLWYAEIGKSQGEESGGGDRQFIEEGLCNG